MTTPYRVELDVFSGPLDLLLFLVRRNELDIVNLKIAEITQQFQQYLTVLSFIDLDQVGDFVVMASTLVEIKSREVLPRAEEMEETVEVVEDPRGELIHQLLEYKKFKDASKALEERAAEWQERYPRLSDDRPSITKDPTADHIKEVELWDLVSALARVIERKEIEQEANIRYDDTPIPVHIDNISKQVAEEGQIRFSTLFDNTTLRSTIIGIFLAILELLRNHDYRASQDEEFGDILILPLLTAEEKQQLELQRAAEVAENEQDAVASADDASKMSSNGETASEVADNDAAARE